LTDICTSETEDLQRTRISISVPADDGLFVPEIWLPNDENEANLGFGVDGLESDVAGAAASPESGDSLEPPANTESSGSSKQYSDAGLQSPDKTTRQRTAIEAAALSRAPRRKKLKLTRNGNTVPALPSSLVKRVAIEAMTRIGKKKPTISRESLTALEQATEWFFEQMGEDLEAYSSHAKRRKRIDDTDVLTLMKRQRVLGRGRSLAELAEEFLPDDILLNLDLHDES
jgi:histone H3/H4